MGAAWGVAGVALAWLAAATAGSERLRTQVVMSERRAARTVRRDVPTKPPMRRRTEALARRRTAKTARGGTRPASPVVERQPAPAEVRPPRPLLPAGLRSIAESAPAAPASTPSIGDRALTSPEG